MKMCKNALKSFSKSNVGYIMYFSREDAGSMLLQNVSINLLDHTAHNL
jgi:hypothetical protein